MRYVSMILLGCCLVLSACDSALAPESDAGALLTETSVTNAARPDKARMNKMLADLRAATARFQRVEVAEDAGYENTFECVSHPTDGAMGVHFVNGALLADANYTLTEPEVLVYEPTRNGRMRLVAAEYLVFREPWEQAGNVGPPMFGDVPFVESFGPAAHGLPDHYELHVWLWRHNPSGMFAQWNPNVACPTPG